MSFSERRELEALPERIEGLEGRVAALHEKLADPSFYREPSRVIAAARRTLAEVEAELEDAFERWSDLERRAAGESGEPAKFGESAKSGEPGEPEEPARGDVPVNCG